MADLNSILNEGDTATAPVVEAPAESAPPASPEASAEPAAPAAGQPRDEGGRFAEKGETPAAEAPAEGAPPAPTGDAALDHPALLAERRMRQAAQDEVARLRAATAPAPAAAPPAPAASSGPPDRWEDPEAYDAWLIQRVQETAEARVRATIEEDRIATSAETARGKYPDYAETVGLFARLAEQNPALEQTLRQHRNPAEYAYQTAKMHAELQQHGSIEALIAAREAKAREAALAEFNKQPGSTSDDLPPSSLAGTQSARSSGVAPPGPPTLDQLLA